MNLYKIQTNHYCMLNNYFFIVIEKARHENVKRFSLIYNQNSVKDENLGVYKTP